MNIHRITGLEMIVKGRPPSGERLVYFLNISDNRPGTEYGHPAAYWGDHRFFFWNKCAFKCSDVHMRDPSGHVLLMIMSSAHNPAIRLCLEKGVIVDNFRRRKKV